MFLTGENLHFLEIRESRACLWATLEGKNSGFSRDYLRDWWTTQKCKEFNLQWDRLYPMGDGKEEHEQINFPSIPSTKINNNDDEHDDKAC